MRATAETCATVPVGAAVTAGLVGFNRGAGAGVGMCGGVGAAAARSGSAWIVIAPDPDGGRLAPDDGVTSARVVIGDSVAGAGCGAGVGAMANGSSTAGTAAAGTRPVSNAGPGDGVAAIVADPDFSSLVDAVVSVDEVERVGVCLTRSVDSMCDVASCSGALSLRSPGTPTGDEPTASAAPSLRRRRPPRRPRRRERISSRVSSVAGFASICAPVVAMAFSAGSIGVVADACAEGAVVLTVARGGVSVLRGSALARGFSAATSLPVRAGSRSVRRLPRPGAFWP